MAKMLEKDKRLVGDAARGKGESLMLLGTRAYWEYDMIGGVQTVEEAQLAIDAAAVCENGAEADSAGDFYKFELQSEKAEGFYAHSALCRVEEVLSGDKDAPMNLAEKYAFGKGLAQNDERACFWTQAAAAAGNEKAMAMMQNFWQLKDPLPISAEMAGKYRGSAPQSSAEVAAVRKALIEKEAADTYAEADRKSSKVTKAFKLENLSESSSGFLNGLLNFIAKLCGKLLTVYIIVSAIVFLINFFTGYQETGLLHYVNVAYEFLLGTPVRFLLVVMTDYEFSEITGAIMCDWFCFNGNLITGVFALLFSGAAIAVWFALCGGAHFVLLMILSMVYRQGVRITPKNNNASKHRPAPCSDAAYMAILSRNPQLQKYSTCQLMAACAIADYYGESFTNACRRFDGIALANEERTLLYTFTYGEKQYRCEMGLYFVLRGILGVKYIPNEKQDFDPKGEFMCAYKEYRQGKNYKYAEQRLQAVIASQNASDKEKAWAKYYIFKMCINEFLYHDEKDATKKKADEATLQRGKTLHTEAKKHCVLTNPTTEVLIANAWAAEEDALIVIGGMIDIPEVSKYLDWRIKSEKSNRFYCGDPNNQEKWDATLQRDDEGKYYTYETKCLRGKLEKVSQEFDKLCKEYEKRATFRSTCEEFRKKLKALRSKAQSICDKGYKLAASVIAQIDEIIKVLDDIIGEYASQSIYEDRMRQEREDAINRQLRQFDERMDERERNINLFAAESYATDEELNIMGKLSDKARMQSDYARHVKREELRKELEQAYDED